MKELLAHIESEVVRQRALLAALERAADEIRSALGRQTPGPQAVAPTVVRSDQTLLHEEEQDTHVEAAKRALIDMGNHLVHFEVIARRAIDSGYIGEPAPADSDETTHAFFEAMRRSTLFEQRGRNFRLKPAFVGGDSAGDPTLGWTVADHAEAVLKAAGGGPMRTRVIMEKLTETQTYKNRKNDENFYNTVSSALDRSGRFDRVSRGVWILKGAEGAANPNATPRVNGRLNFPDSPDTSTKAPR